jgi:hypothetical protein
MLTLQSVRLDNFVPADLAVHNEADLAVLANALTKNSETGRVLLGTYDLVASENDSGGRIKRLRRGNKL